MSRESEMIRRLRILEWLKAELAVCLGEVMRAVAGGVRAPMARALARMIVSCYVLGRHLGIGYQDMDEEIGRCLETPLDGRMQEVEDRCGDYRALRRHCRSKE